MPVAIGLVFLIATIIVTVSFFKLVKPETSLKKLRKWRDFILASWILNQVYWVVLAVLESWKVG